MTQIFGSQPKDAIYLPEIPFSVRLNCKDGGLFIGGKDPEHRRTMPTDIIDISIIKVSKFWGSLGETQNLMWVQIFFIAAPGVTCLPTGAVCVSYIKKQSIAHLFSKAMEVGSQTNADPGKGIFGLKFNKEMGGNGPYYSVGFDWHERTTDEEKQQWDLIEAFLADFKDQLIDLEGTRSMVCIDGMKVEELRELMLQGNQLPLPRIEELPSTAKNNRKALSGR